jgi:hypothetical protein
MSDPSPNPRLQRTSSAPLSRQPLGVLRIMVIAVMVCTPSSTRGEAKTAAPIRDALARLGRHGFRPLSIDNVPALFRSGDADKLTNGGAPVVLEFDDPTGVCKMEFFAGQARWGDQVQSVNVTCVASSRAPVEESLAFIAGGLPKPYRSLVLECLRVFPVAGRCSSLKANRWASVGASLTDYVSQSQWIGTIGISWSGPGLNVQ